MTAAFIQENGTSSFPSLGTSIKIKVAQLQGLLLRSSSVERNTSSLPSTSF